MTDLRNREIRVRDQKRLILPKLNSVTWDPGIDETNPWIYAYLESETHSTRLFEWMRSKKIAPEDEALWIDAPFNSTAFLHWSDILKELDRYFSGRSFKLVSLDFQWILEYQTEGIARFGRWY